MWPPWATTRVAPTPAGAERSSAFPWGDSSRQTQSCGLRQPGAGFLTVQSGRNGAVKLQCQVLLAGALVGRAGLKYDSVKYCQEKNGRNKASMSMKTNDPAWRRAKPCVSRVLNNGPRRSVRTPLRSTLSPKGVCVRTRPLCHPERSEGSLQFVVTSNIKQLRGSFVAFGSSG